MRVGLIGAGAVGALHTDAAAGIDGMYVAAVCSRSTEESQAVAAAHGARIYTDHRDLLGHQGLDAVVISTPHSLHTQMVLDAASAGVHVLVEKPMATTTKDCDAMVSACAAADVALAVGHIQHFLPDKVAAREAVRAGEIGEVVMVHDYRSTDYRPGTRPDWFFDASVAGGGAVMNIGGHCIDRLGWLTDSLPVRVSALIWSRFGVPVETDAFARLTMDSGVESLLTITSTSPDPIDEILVVGQRGSVVADPQRGARLRVGSKVHQLHRPSRSDIPDAFRNQMLAFRDLAQDRTPFPVSTALSRAVVATVLAIYRSAETGAPELIDHAAKPPAGDHRLVGTTAAATLDR